MAKKAGKKPAREKKKGGKQTIAAEQKMRIVERCMSVGVFDAESIREEFLAQGIELTLRTVYDYIKRVRERINVEDNDIRALRRAILIRDTQRYERVIFGRLMEQSIKPQWRDLINLLKIRQQIEAGEHEHQFKDFNSPLPEDKLAELEGKTNGEIDEMILKMVRKGFNIPQLPEDGGKGPSLH